MYLKRLSIIILFFITTLFPARAEIQVITLSRDLMIKQLSPDTYLVTHSCPWPANSLVVRVSPQDIIIVDTPYTNEAIALVVKWIRQCFGNVNITAIITGFHIDNCGGNAYLLKQEIPVYGSGLTAELIKARAEISRKQTLNLLKIPQQQRFYDVIKTVEFHTPDHIFQIDTGLSLVFAEERVEVFFPGASHSPDNVVVYFTKRKILFGGCMIKALEHRTLGFTGDADLQAWPQAVRRVQEKYPEPALVVPGHGQCGDSQLLSHTLQLLKQK